MLRACRAATTTTATTATTMNPKLTRDAREAPESRESQRAVSDVAPRHSSGMVPRPAPGEAVPHPSGFRSALRAPLPPPRELTHSLYDDDSSEDLTENTLVEEVDAQLVAKSRPDADADADANEIDEETAPSTPDATRVAARDAETLDYEDDPPTRETPIDLEHVLRVVSAEGHGSPLGLPVPAAPPIDRHPTPTPVLRRPGLRGAPPVPAPVPLSPRTVPMLPLTRMPAASMPHTPPPAHAPPPAHTPSSGTFAAHPSGSMPVHLPPPSVRRAFASHAHLAASPPPTPWTWRIVIALAGILAIAVAAGVARLLVRSLLDGP